MKPKMYTTTDYVPIAREVTTPVTTMETITINKPTTVMENTVVQKQKMVMDRVIVEKNVTVKVGCCFALGLGVGVSSALLRTLAHTPSAPPS